MSNNYDTDFTKPLVQTCGGIREATPDRRCELCRAADGFGRHGDQRTCQRLVVLHPGTDATDIAKLRSEVAALRAAVESLRTATLTYGPRPHLLAPFDTPNYGGRVTYPEHP